MTNLFVEKLAEKLNLKIISGAENLKRQIETSDISRPALEMAGYFEFYPAERVQILGKKELTFFQKLPNDVKLTRMRKLCVPETPCIIVSHCLPVPEELIEAANSTGIPVLQSAWSTTRLASRLTHYLECELAAETSMHGGLLDLYGVGVLIIGESGIGKSETALELVKRGHQLVADDSVEIRQEDENVVIGKSPNLLEHLLEIRGVGIVNVMTLFGVGAIRKTKRINLVVNLESWQKSQQYDRLGLEEETIKIINCELPKISVPVRPGRNLAVIIEAAAMNYRLKQMGLDAAEQFNEKLSKSLLQGDETGLLSK